MPLAGGTNRTFLQLIQPDCIDPGVDLEYSEFCGDNIEVPLGDVDGLDWPPPKIHILVATLLVL